MFGTPGPAPTPRVLQELRGNPGNRPLKDEPQPTKGAPKPPADLKGEAYAEWCRIVPELDKIGLLSVVDRAYLVGYCESWASFCEAREEIATRGTLVSGRDGNLVKNPATQVMKEALDLMMKLGAQFGLSPAARARLGRVPDAADPEDGPGAQVLSILS